MPPCFLNAFILTNCARVFDCFILVNRRFFTIIDPNTIVIAISQSGETADSLAAIKKAKELGATTLGICNVVGSSIARETDAGIFTHAGPEIGVASTKAFTAQVTVLIMLGSIFSLPHQFMMPVMKGHLVHIRLNGWINLHSMMILVTGMYQMWLI